MPRPRAGYVSKDKKTGKWIARVTFTDSTGRRRNITRKFDEKPEARRALNQLLRQLEENREQEILSEKTTFAQLADRYEQTYLIPPKYVGERKVAGLRSYKSLQRRLKKLREHFYKMPVRNITYTAIEEFKLKLLNQQTHFKKPRSIADVNRVLSLLRCIMKYAVREGLIRHDPFTMGKPLISLADEVKREHILSREDERRLLEAAAIHAEKCLVVRPFLCAAIITAIDTGLRQGELLSVRWRSVDLQSGVLTVESLTAKTLRQRSVPITERVRAELLKLMTKDTKPDDLVFNVYHKSLYNAFASSRKLAGMDFLRFTDFRHTFCSRLAQAGLPIAEVARLAGHANVVTTYRYINADNTTLARAAAILDAFFAKEDIDVGTSVVMIH